MIRNYKILPTASKRTVPYLVNHNWFVNYADLMFLKRVFHGMSRRTTFISNMETSVDALQKDYQLYAKEFSQFFPQLIDYSDKIKRNL